MRDHGPGLPAVVPKAQAWPGYLNTTSLFPLLLADYAPLPEGTVRPGKSVNDMSLAGQHPGHRVQVVGSD